MISLQVGHLDGVDCLHLDGGSDDIIIDIFTLCLSLPLSQSSSTSGLSSFSLSCIDYFLAGSVKCLNIIMLVLVLFSVQLSQHSEPCELNLECNTMYMNYI